MPAAKKHNVGKSKRKPGAERVPNKVLINFVLDKSGSMASIVDDTIGGFNTYLNKLKEDSKAEYEFSLTLFDTGLSVRHSVVPLASVPELMRSTYAPSGGTALLDAIGATVAAVEKRGPTPKGSKVLTVILTDGQENSSREYSLAAIRALIERKEAEGNWTFVFLGAGLNSFAVGDAMGVRTTNTLVYDPALMRSAFANTSAATMDFACSVDMNRSDLYKNVPRRVMASARMMRRADPPHYPKR